MMTGLIEDTVAAMKNGPVEFLFLGTMLVSGLGCGNGDPVAPEPTLGISGTVFIGPRSSDALRGGGSPLGPGRVP